MLPAESFKYFALYSVASLALLAWSAVYCLKRSINFATFVALFTTGNHLRILLNAILLAFLASNLSVQRVVFGDLRFIEQDHLMRVIPLFTMNLLLNLALNGVPVFGFVLLALCVSSKVYHILLTERLEMLHISLLNSYTRHNYSKLTVVRKFLGSVYFIAMVAFVAANFIIAKLLVYEVLHGITSITCVLYGFQFAVIGVDALGYVLKLATGIYEIAAYLLDSGDNTWSRVSTGDDDDNVAYDVSAENDDTDDDDDSAANIWEAKPYFTKGIDIAVSTLKALLHLWFIYILTFQLGLSLPILMLQGTYLSVKQAYTEVKQLLAFIESSKRMDTQLQNASELDLDGSDTLCIICREDMCTPAQYQQHHNRPQPPRKVPKKLWCNHILHLGCLKEWLERSDSCPLCRNSVFDRAMPSDAVPLPPNNAPQPQNNAPQPQNNAPQPQNNAPQPHDNRQDASIPAVPTSTPTPLTSTFTATPTPTAALDASPLQQISLPHLAFVPPDWEVIPLMRAQELSAVPTYHVCLSETRRAILRIKPRTAKHEIPVDRIPVEGALPLTHAP